jgi:two-component system response regulator AtoC
VRLGGTGNIAVDARIITSTKSDLRRAVEAGRFREDLYHRLNAVRITLPPLRERKEEIPLLVQHFLDLYSYRYGRPRQGISKKTERALLNYDWPENIRQLRNTVKRIVVSNDETLVVREILDKEQAPSDIAAPTDDPSKPSPHLRGNLKDVGRRAAKDAERVTIQRMLEQTRWNRREASELLQISYKALLYKIKEYGLDQ